MLYTLNTYVNYTQYLRCICMYYEAGMSFSKKIQYKKTHKAKGNKDCYFTILNALFDYNFNMNMFLK